VARRVVNEGVRFGLGRHGFWLVSGEL
jgi:hypothetical protein